MTPAGQTSTTHDTQRKDSSMNSVQASPSTGAIRRRGAVTRAALSLVLVGLLALGLVAQTALSASAAQPPTCRKAVLPTAIPLSTFAAIGLPSGPAKIVAVRVRVPAGLHFTHLHGGNVYNFMISGTLQVIGDGVTHTYHAGQFFWEPVGHVHTVVTTKPAEFFSLLCLTPQAAPVLPVQGETTAPPPVTMLSTFAAIGLPSGPAKIVALRVRVPVGVHFKHVHGGNVYNFMSSGTVQIIGDGVTHTYHAGQFFWEPVGHVHTLVGIKTAEFYGLQILTPHAAPVQAVQ